MSSNKSSQVENSNNEGYLDVTFIPQLFLQRQAWILDVLRAERVTSVLDVGCGPGDLISCLCEPAQTVDSQPEPGDPILDIFQDLHLKRIAGLDMSSASLEAASKHVLGRVENATSAGNSWWQPGRNRWEALEVKLWLGSLDVFNKDLVFDPKKDSGYEAIVSQEVIEHLPADVLDKFAATLLGAYRPRVLVLTTPSFDFNARFTAPGVIDDRGYLDPTKRTKRIFRHDDHKLEFTRAEFLEYCKSNAKRFGYSVSTECIGSPLEDDPFARVRRVGCATQVAVFRRSAQAPILPPTPSSGAHVLQCQRFFPAHPGPKLEPHAVLKLVEQYLIFINEPFADLHALWYYSPAISIACGGDLRLLARLFLRAPGDWEVDFGKEKALTMQSRVTWKHFVPKPDSEADKEDEWETHSVSSYARSEPEPWAERDDSDEGTAALESSVISTGSGWDEDTLYSSWSSWGPLDDGGGKDWATAEAVRA
ncbi:hypothetical protein EXIGLDRAFT_677711 [Exidia glandulosa HHB12029]|uniref:Small RNA 2'-O-methyltransferase n=1 Tax=Exidia glandulosa HHB12029 TaxID=1314781 RepID=A0A165G0K0_EXIGL|nr:hypothetical protein EXIGLDRAFT_677711 [Exidia glandulosa HHB12029]